MAMIMPVQMAAPRLQLPLPTMAAPSLLLPSLSFLPSRAPPSLLALSPASLTLSRPSPLTCSSVPLLRRLCLAHCASHPATAVQDRSQEEQPHALAVPYTQDKDGVITINDTEGAEGEDVEDLVLGGDAGEDEEDFGEVNRIVSSRVVDGTTEYLIDWKDDHPDSWEPPSNIAQDVISEYEQPWWQAARKANEESLKKLLEYEGRDVNSVDENQRTALFFGAGMGSEKCVRLLVEAGADVHWQDKDGFTALHIAAGYVHTSVVKTLLEFGADPELEDAKGRSSLQLAQELLERTPRTNPMQFARRLALDQVVKALDMAIYDEVEVEQILDKRKDEKGITEYLVKWSDGSEASWEPTEQIGEDLVKDFEEGLEYGIAERIWDKREIEGKTEYLVQWVDSEKNTWEPAENVAEEVIAEFEKERTGSRQV